MLDSIYISIIIIYIDSFLSYCALLLRIAPTVLNLLRILTLLFTKILSFVPRDSFVCYAMHNDIYEALPIDLPRSAPISNT